MTRSELAALREGQSVCPVTLTQAEAAALNRSRLVTAQPEADGWRITAEYAVGAVRCGGLVVRVTPKVGVLKVLTLLVRAHGLKGLELDPSLVELAADADLSGVLALLFALEADRALAGGPLRGYRAENQTLPVLRGRLRMRQQYLRRYGVLLPLEVTVDEWTVDTDDNRRIRAAGRRLLGLPELPQRARVGLLRLDQLLADVRVPPPGAAVGGWTPTRLNIRLQRLLHLSDLVLAHTNVEHAAGDVRTQGFVINMAWLFEKLVAQLLGEAFPGLEAQETLDLDTLSRLTIRPDLVFHDALGPVAVADTKYKLLDGKGQFPNADAYQLVTYCLLLGLPVGHLIYARDGDAREDRYVMQAGGITLYVHALDLMCELHVVEERIYDLGVRFLDRPLTSAS